MPRGPAQQNQQPVPLPSRTTVTTAATTVGPILQPAKSGLHAVADDKLDPGEQASEKQADELHDHVTRR